MTLYLYDAPFVIDQEKTKDYLEHLYDHLGDSEREDLQTIDEYYLRFIARNKLIVEKDGAMVMAPISATGVWQWFLLHQSFRSMVDSSEYAKVMQALQANKQDPINQLLELHVTLGSLFDRKLLNTIVNRTIHAVSLIPYDLPKDIVAFDWPEIHRQTPFIWLLIQIQIALHRHAALPV